LLRSTTVASGLSGIDAHPAVSEQLVAYQSLASGTIYLNAWDIAAGTDPSATDPSATPSTISHAMTGGLAPNPSYAKGNWVSFETANSVESAFVAGNWDPGMPPFNPSAHACSSFRQMKMDRSDIQLVQGVGCPEAPSVLYAMVRLLDSSYHAFFVGKLGANGEYAIRGDEIVFTDGNGDVTWVRADMAQMGDYIREAEPNDNASAATPLPDWKIGTGNVLPGEVDFWAVELLQGVPYQIATGRMGPGGLCYYDFEDKNVALYDAFGNLLAQNDDHFGLYGNTWLWNQCGIIESFIPNYDGVYYVAVSGTGTYSDYQLGVTPN